MKELPNFITDPNPEIYLSDNYVVLDLETTNASTGDARDSSNRIVYAYLWHSKTGGTSICDGVLGLSNFADLLYGADFIVAHNAKFELKWLHRAGIQLEKLLVYDTMLGDYVRAGNRRWKLTLDECAKRYGIQTKYDYVSKLIKNGVCPSEIPEKALQFYCQLDVKITKEVMVRQRHILHEEGLLPVFFIRNLTTPVISEMEMNGMYLDKQLVHEIHNELNTEYNGLLKELDEITGGINMGSPVQVANFLYNELKFPIPTDRKGKPLLGQPKQGWPNGVPKTDEDAIKLLKPKTQKQKKFIELKQAESKLRKKITGYSNRFIEVCDNNNCLMLGDFNQAITQTHRLSSSKPNLQNIDRKLKKVITARQSGWKIRSADYSQLEFRVAGMLAQDKQALEDIRTNFDVHSYTASIIFAEEWMEAGSSRYTPKGEELRSDVKPHTFKPLYGGQSGTPNEVAYYEAFRKKYPQITEMQRGWVDEALETQQLRTATGLIFYFPGTEYTRSGYVQNSTNIMNYPVQMFATADIAPTGVALLWHNMKAHELKSFLIAEVHDSAVAEEHPDDKEIMEQLIPKCMAEDIVPFFKQVIGFDINYPMEVEYKLNTHWDYTPKEKLNG